MEYDFYWMSGSPNAWRAMLALEYKGIAYNSHRLDAGKKEHKTPAYLALNPLGKVPVLKHGDTVVRESIAIMAWLERLQPEPALFGSTADETGRVWQRIFEFVNGLRNSIDDGVVRAMSRPQSEERDKALGVSAVKVHETLGNMESDLRSSAYLAGNELSAADFAVLPNIAMLIRFGTRPEAQKLDLKFDTLRSDYPAIDRWLKRLEALPAFDASYPPHWRSS